MFDQGGGERIGSHVIGTHLHKHFDGLALHGVGHANRRGFGDGGMRHQRAFYFRGADAVSGDVKNVVVAAEDGNVSVFIFHGHIAGYIASGNPLPITLVTGGVAPYCAQHVRERPLQHEPAAHAGGRGLAIFVEHIRFRAGHGDAALSRAHGHRGRRAESRSA